MNFRKRKGESDDESHLISSRGQPKPGNGSGNEAYENLAVNYGSLDNLDPQTTHTTNNFNENAQGQVVAERNENGTDPGTSSSSENTIMAQEASPSKTASTDTVTTSTNSIRTVSSSTSKFSDKVTEILKKFHVHPALSQIIVYSILPLLIWVVLFLVVGRDNLPGGTVFLLVLLECGGRLLGYLVSLIQLPPMVGMLGLGIAVSNLPLDLMLHYESSVSAPIRQIALAVILTRAGFGLDLNTLLKFKWLVLRLAVAPTVLEALSVAVATHLLLGFPWVWGILVGFVVAAVSPAVIVPRILELKAQGYGEQKGIPTVILAAASLDNVVAISLFGVALSFIFSADKGIAMMVLQCPLEVLAGIGFGFVWGLVNAFIFNPSRGKEADADESFVKGAFVLAGGIVSIFGFKLIDYSGAGALGCIFSAFVTVSVWKYRGFSDPEINQIKWGFTFLWKFFEPLLFGVIGCQIILRDLEGRTVALSIAALLIGTAVRFIVTYGTVSMSGYSVKERLFTAISWVPKATVQAAIGPAALDYAKNMKSSDAPELQRLATDVLTIAVVVILLTAPIGEFAVMLTGPRFLSKSDKKEHPAPNDDSKGDNVEIETCPA